MANASIVRQDAEAAARRYAEYGNLIAQYNAGVDAGNSGNQAAIDLYNQQVAEFNTFVSAVKNREQYGLYDMSEGAPGATSYLQTPFTEAEQAQQDIYTDYVQEQQQNLLNNYYAQQAANGNSEAGGAPPVYDPNTDYNPNKPVAPTATYTESPWRGSYAMVQGDGSGKIIPASMDNYGQPRDSGGLYDSMDQLPSIRPDSPGITRLPSSYQGEQSAWVKDGSGNAVQYVASNGQWVQNSAPVRLMSFDKAAPTQQTDFGAVPEAPKDWNPSLRDIKELNNPTQDAAGAAMLAAQGSAGNTGIINEASKNNESLTDSDTGILSRVMQGKL